MTTYGMSAVNCTIYPNLQPNPDISGIGVLIGFLATAYLTLICCVAKTILDHKSSACEDQPKFERWAFALGNTIVTFSDQQLITGMSVIIGGISQLQWGLSSYHWQAVINLSWFSTVTHLITLTVLRDDVRSNKPIQIFRITAIGVLVVMLLCVTGPIGYLTSNASIPDAFPAWCLYQPGVVWADLQSNPIAKQYNWVYAALTLGLLIFAHVRQVSLLVSNSANFSHNILRIPEGQPWELFESRLSRVQNMAAPSRLIRIMNHVEYKLLRSIYALLVAGNDLYGSKVWEITCLTFALVWGTIRLFVTRNSTFDAFGFSQDVSMQQDIWGFGQVVSLGLLILPLISFFEAYFLPEANSSNKRLLTHIPLNTLPAQTIQLARDRSPGRSSEISSIRQALYKEPWYEKLVALWYLLSIAIASDLLYSFPADNGSQTLTDPSSGLWGQVLQYLVWAVLDLAILWFSTLLFLDQHVQQAWEAWSLRILISSKVLSTTGWLFVILILLGISICYDVIDETKNVPGLAQIDWER